MNIQQDIADIESRLAEAGVAVDDFCKQAGIHRSNWQRWKAGVTIPNMRNWQRALDAVPQDGKAA